MAVNSLASIGSLSRSLMVAQTVRCKHRTILPSMNILQRSLHTTCNKNKSFGTDRLPAGQHTIPESREQFEVSTAEWAYVERLFPPPTIPKPLAKPGEVKPSGWVAPSAKPGDHPYFVHRAPSHLYPVYLKNTAILNRYITSLNHIEGDIFKLAEDLRAFLEPRRKTRILNMRTHEPHQKIHIKGQYVAEVKQFLFEKGF